MSIAKALLQLTPGAQWVIRDDVIDWMDTEQTQPTQEEIVQKIAEIAYTEEVESYKEVRAKAYPVMSEQLDKIFHEGIDAWKAEIQAIKDAHPKAVIDNDTLNSRKSQALSNHQLQEYTKAVVRLAKYQVALGREEVTEETVVGTRPVLDENDEVVLGSEGQVTCEDVVEQIVTVTSIDPVDATVEQTTYDDEGVATTNTVENPLITEDNAERAAAQTIVDATPQSVIDTYNE